MDGLQWVARNAINKAVNKALITMHFGRNTSGSICVWQGASLHDGSPIMVCLSAADFDSANRKTGAMIQVSILPVNEAPHEVYFDKAPSVCGDCKYLGGGCYVRWSHLQRVQSSSVRNIGDLQLGKRLCAGLRIRIGSAGDPSSVPIEVWETLLADADGWTGYTHMWRTCDPKQRFYFMASTDSTEESLEAMALGYKPFQVIENDDEVLPDSILCLAHTTDKYGLQMTCTSCMKCNPQNGHTKIIHEYLHGANNTIKYAKGARSR